jgi:hypothetical protein
MRIRIVKLPPAPMMDGYAVADFELGRVYEVDTRVGWYLIVAGYAEAQPEKAEAADRSRPASKQR